MSDAVTHLNLTSRPSSERFCQGPAVFTCNGTLNSIEDVLFWVLNDARISEYNFDSRDRYPLDLTYADPNNNVLISSIQVVNASVDPNGSTIEVVSTLRVYDVSLLNRSFLRCENLFQQSNTFNFAVLDSKLYRLFAQQHLDTS